MTEPTEEDLKDPLFEAVWDVIKGWDIRRSWTQVLGATTGTDAMAIVAAVRAHRGDARTAEDEDLLPVLAAARVVLTEAGIVLILIDSDDVRTEYILAPGMLGHLLHHFADAAVIKLKEA